MLTIGIIHNWTTRIVDNTLASGTNFQETSAFVTRKWLFKMEDRNDSQAVGKLYLHT